MCCPAAASEPKGPGGESREEARVIYLSGHHGAGKTAAAELLRKRGAVTFDCGPVPACGSSR